MKKLILLFLLFPIIAFAQGMQPVGHVVTVGSSYTEEFFFNGDYPSHTDYAQTAHKTGTLQGVTVTDTFNIGTASASQDGGNWIDITGWNDHVTFCSTFACTAGIFSNAEGFVDFLFKEAATTDDHEVIYVVADANNEMAIKLKGNNTLYFKRVDNNGGSHECYAVTTATFTDATWTRAQVYWSVTDDNCGVKICTSQTDCTNSFTTASATSTAWASSTAPTALVIGCSGGSDGGMQFDAFKIWKTKDGT